MARSAALLDYRARQAGFGRYPENLLPRDVLRQIDPLVLSVKQKRNNEI